MMSRRSNQSSRTWVIPASIAIAMLLSVVSYPDWMRYAVPHWVSLVIFYWCIAAPDRMNVGSAWVAGLVLDLLLHTLFGVHAITAALVALAAVTSHQRLRMYHIWQQCLVVFVIACIEVTFVGWVFYLTNDAALRLVYWQAALTTALLWPVVYTTLRIVRQRSGISRIR